MTHAEEAKDYPKIVGNMIVFSREPTTGYKLICSCEQEFDFVPTEKNSIDVFGGGATRKVRAMCPLCKAVWFEDTEFVHRRTVLYFVCCTGIGEKLKIAGLGKAFSKAEAINLASNGVREDDDAYTSFTVKFFTKEEFDRLQTEKLKTSVSRTVALLAASMGLNPEEF